MLLILMGMILCFFLISLKQVNVVVVTTISIIYFKNCVVKNLNVKVFSLVSGINETRRIEWHQTCKWNVDLTVVFIIINNVGMMINVSENAKNWLIKHSSDPPHKNIKIVSGKKS